MSLIKGRRILVVEDESLVAMLVEDVLEDAGAILIGPATTVHGAMALLDDTIDAAVLDVNLDGVNSSPVADALRLRGVPFVFATGYGAEGLPSFYRDHNPVLTKPYNPEELLRVLEGMFY